MIDNPKPPAKRRSLIITLLNGEILDRHPYATGLRTRPLPVSIDEFSGIKILVMRKLLAWMRTCEGGGAVVR